MYEQILGRKHSSKRYAQERAAIEALPIEMCENASDNDSASRALQLLEAARPPRGQRENHPTTPRIVALQNRIQHGVKNGRNHQPTPAPNGAAPTKTNRLVFGQATLDKNGRIRKPKPATTAQQLSLFG